MLGLPPLAKALPSIIPSAKREHVSSTSDTLGSSSSSLGPPPSSGPIGASNEDVPQPPLAASSGSESGPAQSSVQLTPTTSFENGQLLKDVDASVPILPSQLRRRHESMKLLARTVQKQQVASVHHEPVDQDVTLSTLYPQAGADHDNLASAGGRAHHRGSNSDLHGEDETEGTLTLSIGGSSHPETVAKTQPHSMLFEATTSDTIATLAALSAQTDLGFTEMPTRDWIQMQSKIQALETEVFHVSRTNRLLNDELDKLTGILARLAAGEDDFQHPEHEQKQVEGNKTRSSQPAFRKEYHFLVQQVDLMHRQLQAAQSELGSRTTSQGRARVEEMEVARSTEVTRQLHAEVKDLTASLKMWQSALQQTDSQYRRKCDDERALKQTLRERETELSSLMEKLEQSRLHGGSNSSDNSSGNNATNNTRPSGNESGMPGTFPEALSAEAVQAHTRVADQLAVSLVSWAALLVTSMMS
ncbi:hypothetical protein BGZ70_004940 [Mortierella alpina]|uniref:Uncharacterized protein n=1 Tax=Mortierella alpina TaxID=64518 RepID=A0A9P6JA44_MORAP|nr:hypothetical protein BGZ70_004940 [Mortierella alpina]